MSKELSELIAHISSSCGVPAEDIIDRKRRSREVSDAKMLFCYTAWRRLKEPQCEIARFLGWPRTNVNNLLKVALHNLRYVP